MLDPSTGKYAQTKVDQCITGDVFLSLDRTDLQALGLVFGHADRLAKLITVLGTQASGTLGEHMGGHGAAAHSSNDHSTGNRSRKRAAFVQAGKKSKKSYKGDD